ncbi:MAG: hypothetical protein ACJ79K_02725 [Gemmatimonadaceae bacterium]
MPTMTTEQSRTIAKLYSDLASALADFRFTHWTQLTRAQRAEIESHEWTLLTYSSNMAGQAVRLAVADINDAVAGITRATKRLTAAARKITSIKRAFAIATSGVALGGAIASGHGLAIGEAVRDALRVGDR